ncbi:hypothetical protein FPQ18DRAFT_25789 [Pyronema domesticum]|uniref:Fungal N-terminal domain-containing protein n=1 Tax=Pyronema omphalodes (strain CBS 100304) TaxID=1076935 RepID=U4LSK8_PYROM|nr:hypothetical protein FPQ18DRAFT_25789 [Pyronema domesticum]CCX34599.1 Similar to predicted protein [Aspergillus terreus NIH2624]; acc. no. XP_001213559 [Pyronema omphalodes CBS 100304]
MADPLSVSANVAGLIGLANEVGKIPVNYASNVKSAHEDAHCLQKELTALCHVLEQMRSLLREEKLQGTRFEETAALVSVLGFTNHQVNELYKKLDKLSIQANKNKLADFWERIRWPLKKDECDKAMEEMRRLAQYFQFSLTAANRLDFLSQTK